MATRNHHSTPIKDTVAATGANAGAFLDHRDGTVTDLTTGLVWEKKCNCPGSLHHYQMTFAWSGDGERETIWDWIENISTEGIRGFAGHHDWRIPNVKELVSILDYERTDPAISPVFDVCEAECSEPAGQDCGCTASGPYWTSTTFADFPAHALVVGFLNGDVDDHLKTLRAFARAVRGPVPVGSGDEPGGQSAGTDAPP